MTLHLTLQEPDAWEILKDCEQIADEYKTRYGDYKWKDVYSVSYNSLLKVECCLGLYPPRKQRLVIDNVLWCT